MMRNAVGYQCHAALPRHLLHHGGFPDTGRAHQQNGSLSDRRNTVFPKLVLRQIRLNGIFDFFLRFFNIHAILLTPMRRQSQGQILFPQYQLHRPWRHADIRIILMIEHKCGIIGRSALGEGAIAVCETNQTL